MVVNDIFTVDQFDILTDLITTSISLLIPQLIKDVEELFLAEGCHPLTEEQIRERHGLINNHAIPMIRPNVFEVCRYNPGISFDPPQPRRNEEGIRVFFLSQ